MTTTGRKQVLLLDDSALTLDMAKTVLEAAGFGVLTAVDLAALEGHLARSKPDLVLLDVQMPEAFGDDVGMVLRAVKGMQVPILLVSSLGDTELAQRAREAGVDGFISKRAGLDALVERVCAILGQGPRQP
ncbi:MAG: response regulator [Deltaproteobacteria bacterium]|nr:response regulator [Deltaproteobacteria bacterium]